MTISARNVFKGKVSKINEGSIKAEAEITTAGGDKIVAMVTDTSVKSLGLSVGKDAVAVVKASWVVLLSGASEYRFSARNQMKGTVTDLVKGGVNCQASIALPSGATVCAMLTNDAVADLGLKNGMPVVALFKAGHVLLGVPA